MAGAVTLLLRRLTLRRRRNGRGGPGAHEARSGPPAAAVDFYEAAVRVLQRYGHRRRMDQSPREFLDAVRSVRGEAVRPFVEITLTFEGVRYGRKSLTTAERKALAGHAEELGVRLASPEGDRSV